MSSFNSAEGAGAARGRLGEIAAAAEEAGFASLWVMDHFIQIPQVGPIEALRPNSRSVDEFGATVNAGTIADQVGRFRSLTEAGVHVAIVALSDLTDATAVTRFEPIIDAFSG